MNHFHVQLEKVIDEVLKSGDVQALDVFLQRDIYEGTPIKCSQQFLTKLDKLISRVRCSTLTNMPKFLLLRFNETISILFMQSLDQKDSKSASLGFAIVYKCGKNLKVPGGRQGLSEIITQGLIKKISIDLKHMDTECEYCISKCK